MYFLFLKLMLYLNLCYKKYILLICLKYINFINKNIKRRDSYNVFYIHYTKKLDE